MSTIQASRRERLVALRDYLLQRSRMSILDGNTGRGLKRWATDLDAVLKTHGEER